MSSPDTGIASTESGLDVAVIERAAERVGIEKQRLCDALVVLHAELIGRHSQFERDDEYVTVEGTRAYRVPDEECDELLAEFDFDDDVAAAVRLAHTEQAKLMFAMDVAGDDNFDSDECGVVVGIDTAEQF